MEKIFVKLLMENWRKYLTVTESLSKTPKEKALAAAWMKFSQNAAHAGYDTEEVYSTPEMLQRVLDEVSIEEGPGVSKKDLFNFIEGILFNSKRKAL